MAVICCNLRKVTISQAFRFTSILLLATLVTSYKQGLFQCSVEKENNLITEGEIFVSSHGSDWRNCLPPRDLNHLATVYELSTSHTLSILLPTGWCVRTIYRSQPHPWLATMSSQTYLDQVCQIFHHVKNCL